MGNKCTRDSVEPRGKKEDLLFFSGRNPESSTSLSLDRGQISTHCPAKMPSSPDDVVSVVAPLELLPAVQKPPPPRRYVLGVIGGSSLFHAKSFSADLKETVIETEFGGVVAHVGNWRQWDLQIVFIQRHHADPDGEYKQPRQINFRAIATALKTVQCDAVLGVYSVGSMNAQIGVGRLVVPEDYFNPFDILHMSREYDAHVVPDVCTQLRERLVRVLQESQRDPYDGGVYIQTAGPRFETKAEVRFFKQFGELIGMTGANEAELINELRIPFAMISIVDNLANGIGEQLTVRSFSRRKVAQMSETDIG
jgi:purine nucleoside phosphorylase